MTAPASVFFPPNALRAKVGGRFSGIGPDAIAKAESTLKEMEAKFGEWLAAEIAKLDAAQAAIREEGYTPATASRLYSIAHDLKGLGTTYGYPFVTRLAASLSKLMGNTEARMRAPIALVDAHIDAIRAVVRDDLRADDDALGLLLSETLEAKVALVV